MNRPPTTIFTPSIAIREKIKIFEPNEPDLTKIIKAKVYLTKTQTQNYQHNKSNEFLDNLVNCVDKMMPPLQQGGGSVITDSQGLIVPKKLLNPCLESHDRQNLHRELLFNQKVGKSVLNQKSELQKALEKQKERQMLSIQQQQQQQHNNKHDNIGGELERVIMQRAQRLENGQQNNDKDDLNLHVNPEYLNARAKLRPRIDTK